MTTALTTIAFDADDTLWHNEQYFQMTQAHFQMLLKDFAEPEHLSQKLLEAERKNLAFYGYGVKGFTLSMIETAIEVTHGGVDTATLLQILKAGRDIMTQPVELLPGVKRPLETLKDDYELIIITKGDLFDQERKIAQSGLGDFFDDVEIVSEKNTDCYKRIFNQAGRKPERSMMVGNSVKSDIVPALEAGAFAVHIPYHLTWELERKAIPVSPRLFLLDTIEQLPELITKITYG